MSYFRILPADNQIVWRRQDYHSAHPTGRKRVDRCRFCDEVAHATTYIGAEVEALLRLAVEMVKRQVENGDILEFGDICTLTSSFQRDLCTINQSILSLIRLFISVLFRILAL